ncbi:MAG: nuclear transport factor 2 family protein [Maribacter sp.]|uniref:nuclear transport factor 2 family protein n=1 Tax=Maribacter sp. TaxID=1897614 RepID=UPI0032994A5E
MKQLLLLGILLLSVSSAAQDADKYAVQKTIEAFFEGFHQQDSIAIKETVANDVLLQTIAKDSLGKDYVRTEDFTRFIKSIVSIPETTKFQETIKSYSIQVDGPMANAWTAYEFHVNDKFSHCGVNSFQLVKQEDKWKIIYLIDTRRKEGCE